MRAFILAAAAMLSAPVAYAQEVGFDTFTLGQSATSIEKARDDRVAGIRTQIERARAAGALTGAGDPYLSPLIGQVRIPGGYQFTLGNVRVLATCRERGMRIYAIMQKREFRGVTPADVMPALKAKYGASPKIVRLSERPGSTAIDQWVLWNGIPADMTGGMVESWGQIDSMKVGGVSLPAGLSAHVQHQISRTDVELTSYSPEIAADTEKCVSDARAASRKAALDAVKF